jgi:hypothetical protein
MSFGYNTSQSYKKPDTMYLLTEDNVVKLDGGERWTIENNKVRITFPHDVINEYETGTFESTDPVYLYIDGQPNDCLMYVIKESQDVSYDFTHDNRNSISHILVYNIITVEIYREDIDFSKLEQLNKKLWRKKKLDHILDRS